MLKKRVKLRQHVKASGAGSLAAAFVCWADLARIKMIGKQLVAHKKKDEKAKREILQEQLQEAKSFNLTDSCPIPNTGALLQALTVCDIVSLALQ